MNLTMRLFPRHVKGKLVGYYVEGSGIRRTSLGTKNKDEATRAFNQLKQKVLLSKLHQLTGECNTTLGAFKTEYLAWAEDVIGENTFRANKLGLKKLAGVAGETIKLDRINLKHVDLLIAESKRNNLKANTINNYIRHARTALNKAVDWGHIRKNPLADAKEIPVSKTLPRYLEREQVTHLLKSIKCVDLRRYVVSYIATGRRRASLVRLQWQDVNLDTGRYLISHDKGHLQRLYPINALFRSVLLAIGPKKEGRVFARWKHPDTVSHKIKVALVKAGFPDLTLHSLRHTYASLKIMEGYTLKQVQELLGHSDMKTTQIYAHINDDHLADIAEVNIGPVNIVN